MYFSQVIGQTKTKSQLISDINSDKIPHAQLFYGTEGVGKLALALAYAQYLNCENRNIDDSCGKCISCIKASKNIHPDIHFSFPVFNKGGNRPPISQEFLNDWRTFLNNHPYGNIEDWLSMTLAENKPANITKEECREIVKKLSLKTYEAKFKIMIIWLPEFLGNNANSLLKILEEPTSNTIFILIAENKDKILNTVISRTQTFHIPPIDKESISVKLSEEFKLDKNHASWISNISQGNYRKARILSLEEDNINESFIKDWLNICYTSKPVKLVEWSEQIAKESRINQIGFLQYTSNILRQSLLGYYGNVKANSQTEEKLSRSLIEKIEFEGLEIFHNKISDSIMHIDRNANAKILFLNLSIELSKLLKKRT